MVRGIAQASILQPSPNVPESRPPRHQQTLQRQWASRTQSLPALLPGSGGAASSATALHHQTKDVPFAASAQLSRPPEETNRVALPPLHNAAPRPPPVDVGHSGMRRTQQFMWSQSATLLRKNSGQLPFLESPLPRVRTYELDDVEMEERAAKLRTKMERNRWKPREQPKPHSKIQAMLASPEDKVEKRKRNEAHALEVDRRYVQAQLEAMAEPPEASEEKENVVKDRSWNAIFAPIPSPRRLLPPSFLGEYPSALTMGSRSPVRPKRSTIAGMSAQDLPLLEEEDVTTIIQVCSLFQRLLATMDLDGGTRKPPPIICRSAFCRLICALNGMAAAVGAPTKLARAAQLFDSMAERIANRWGQHLGGASIPAIRLDMGGSRAETPVCLLFSKLLHDMALELGSPSSTYQDRVSSARSRFFRELLPEAKRYAEERAQRLRGIQKPATSAVDHGAPDPAAQHAKDSAMVRAHRPKPLQKDLIGRSSTSSVSRGPPPHHHGLRVGDKPVAKAKAHIADEPAEEEQPSISPQANPLYGNTFAVLKGEVLSTQLLEPEMLHFVAEFSGEFRRLFNAYSDVTVGHTRAGVIRAHMTLGAFLRFCRDFKLFPTIVDLATAQWLYTSAEGWEELCWEDDEEAKQKGPLQRLPLGKARRKKSFRRSLSRASSSSVLSVSDDGECPSPTSMRRSLLRAKTGPLDVSSPRSSASGSQPPSPGGARPRPRSQKQKAAAKDPGKFVLWQGKWLKAHVEWLTKDAKDLSPVEHRSLMILWAIEDLVRDTSIDVPELFAFFDHDHRGTVSADEFREVVMFMRFQDPPSSAEVDELFSRLATPSAAAASGAATPTSADGSAPASPVSARQVLWRTKTAPVLNIQTSDERSGSLELEIATFRSVLAALRKHKENLSVVANPFLKEYHRMTQAEVDTLSFFNGLWVCLEDRSITPQEFCASKFGSRDKLSAEELKASTVYSLRLLGKQTQALFIERPFDSIVDGAGMISREDLVRVFEQVKEARQSKEASSEAKLNLYAANIPQPPPPQAAAGTSHGASCRRRLAFGHQAFTESVLKIALLHLSYHGSAIHADQPGICKAIWLLLYLRWQFQLPQRRAAAAKSSAGNSIGQAPVPRYVTPMQRLMEECEDLFGNAPARPPPNLSELAELARPLQIVAAPRPGRRSQVVVPAAGSVVGQSPLPSSATKRPGRQQHGLPPTAPSQHCVREKHKPSQISCKACERKVQLCGWGNPTCPDCSFADALLQSCLDASPPAASTSNLGAPSHPEAASRCTKLASAPGDSAGRLSDWPAADKRDLLPRFRDRTLLAFATAC